MNNTTNIKNIGVNNANETAEKKRPETKFKAGALSATIWKNAGKSKDGQDTEYFSISIDRNYTDKAGIWKSTNSLRVNDLPKAALVLKKAYEYIVLKEMDKAEA